MSAPAERARARWWLGAALVVAIAAWAPRLAGEFVWDDKVYLLEEPRFARGAPLLPVLRDPIGQVHRPLSFGTLWAQVQLHGMSLVALRAVQLAIHLACAVLLFAWLARRLRSPGAAAFGASLFLVHPAATEPVMLLNARHDLLGALFVLLALLLVDDGRSARRAWLAGLCTLLAIACKESYVVLVPLIALQAALLGGPFVRAAVPALVAAVTAFVGRSLLGISLSSALAAGPLELARAFAALFVRHGRAFVTFTDAETADRYVRPSTLAVALVAAIVVALLVIGWRARGDERARAALLACALIFLGLLPSIAAIPATGQHGNRYGYLALAGFAALVAVVIGAVSNVAPHLRRAGVVVAAVLVVALAVRASVRAAQWRDGLSLFGADVARDPDDSRAAYHYGVEVMAARGCGAALPWFERAARAEPAYARALRNEAGCLLRLARPGDALDPATRAARLEPGEAAHRRNLAGALLGVGRVEEARAELAEAERLQPGAPQNAALRRLLP